MSCVAALINLNYAHRLTFNLATPMYYETIKVLDCTIRDGGLVNKHDFSLEFVRRLYTLLSAAGLHGDGLQELSRTL